eukprot:TRINITY_DN1975_c0_g1_i1.p1 TRINITY_DN1975_c0_g1~~TRINITY_DN1975_c0_g1_i1.p1  ORF type:complete len:917 (+),score=334.70 TRINITY_DN1975_c0_g1_i1:89-2839(+)
MGDDEHARFNKDAEITVQQLLTFLLRDLLKTKHYRRLPLYFIFLFFLTLLPMLTAVGDFRYNEAAEHNQVVGGLFQKADLLKVRTQEEFWVWSRRAVTEIWVRASSNNLPEVVCSQMGTAADCVEPCFWSDSCRPPWTSRPNIALGFLLIRQWRVSNAVQCASGPSVKAIAPTLRDAVLDHNCTGRYSSATVSTEPFGKNLQFRSDKERGVRAAGRTVVPVHLAFDPEDQFSERLPLGTSLNDTLARIKALESAGYITPESRCICLSAIIYNHDIESFVSVDSYVTVSATGALRGGYASATFPILNLDDHTSRFLFVLDIMHVIFVPVLVYSIARTIRDQASWLKIPGSSAVGLWDVYEIVQISFHAVVCTYRVSLWAKAFQITDEAFYADVDDPEGLMFNELSSYGEDWGACWGWFASVIIFAFLRIFKYLQYNDRLCVLSETVRSASGDLAGLFIIIGVVLTAYSIAGTMLYASEIDAFSSFTTTFFFLTQVLFAGEVVGDRWNSMFEVHPFGTPAFMLSYLVISWMVLLNMVIAALSNAFILVVSQQAMHRKSGASGNTGNSLWRVVKRGLKKMWDRMRGDDELVNLQELYSSPAASLPGSPASPVPASPGADMNKKRGADYFLLRRAKSRFAAVQSALKMLAVKKSEREDHGEDMSLQEKLTTVAVSWGDIATALQDILPNTAMEQMFVRVHKFIASNDFHDLSTLTTKYYSKLSDDVEELLQILRTTGGKQDGGMDNGELAEWRALADAEDDEGETKSLQSFAGESFSPGRRPGKSAIRNSTFGSIPLRNYGGNPLRRPRFGSESGSFLGGRSSVRANRGRQTPADTSHNASKERVTLEYGGTWFPAFLEAEAAQGAAPKAKWFSDKPGGESLAEPLIHGTTKVSADALAALEKSHSMVDKEKEKEKEKES